MRETLDWFVIRVIIGLAALVGVSALIGIAGILGTAMYTLWPWSLAIPLAIAVCWVLGYFITEEWA